MKKKINAPKAKSKSPKKVAKPKRISSYNKLKDEIAKLWEDKVRVLNDIYTILDFKGSFMDREIVKARYNRSYNEEKMIWRGESTFKSKAK